MSLISDALGLLPSGPPSAPADLDALVEQLDVQVQYTRGRKLFYGATDFSTPRPTIELAWVRPGVYPSAAIRSCEDSRGLQPHNFDARTRFTLAHELGHVLVRQLSLTSTAAARLALDEEERLCDAIAASLLMPTDWFRSQVGSTAQPGFRTLRDAAGRAGASMSAAVIRARTLNYPVASAVLSRTEPGSWVCLRFCGVWCPDGINLGEDARALFEGMPRRTVTTFETAVVCSGHVHTWVGEASRSQGGATALLLRIDGRVPPANYFWRCRGAKPGTGSLLDSGGGR